MVTVQGWFLHGDYLTLYDGAPEPDPAASRATLPFSERLAQVEALSAAPLSEPRAFDKRVVVTCRDYALALTSLLRAKGREARLRCGFATYFPPNRFEDHWICEYRRPGDTLWQRADAQFDGAHRRHLAISFDPAALPASAFLTAAEAWKALQQGRATSDEFRHGSDGGHWFLQVNLARDLLALAGQVTSPWDDWRNAGAAKRNANQTRSARIAQAIRQAEARGPSEERELAPFWL